MSKLISYEKIKNFMYQKPLLLIEKEGDQILLVTGIRRGGEKLDPCYLQISGSWVNLEEIASTYNVVGSELNFYR